MIYAGPTDAAVDEVNRAVYVMSLEVERIARQSTAGDATTATYKLAASLDYMATTLEHIRNGQAAATAPENASLTQAVALAQQAAQAARDAAAMTLARHQPPIERNKT